MRTRRFMNKWSFLYAAQLDAIRLETLNERVRVNQASPRRSRHRTMRESVDRVERQLRAWMTWSFFFLFAGNAFNGMRLGQGPQGDRV